MDYPFQTGRCQTRQYLHQKSQLIGSFAAYLRHVDAIEAEGGTDLGKAIDAVLRRSPRPGLLAVVSDFLDGGDVLGAIARAALAGHDVVLVHVVALEELEPKFDGDFALEDAETGAVVEVTMDARALEAYALRLMGLSEELRAFAKRHRASYVRVRTDEPLEPVIRRIVAREVD